MSKNENRLIANNLPRYQKLGETEASQDLLGGLTLGNPLREGDKEGTINNIMERMEAIALHDDYMRSTDRNYKTPKDLEDEFDNYKKELKKLGVSFDELRGWYYERHPTPEMQSWQKAGEALNKAFYDTLGPSPSQEKKEDVSKRQGKKFISRNNKNGK